jgi:hypothetical protein
MKQLKDYMKNKILIHETNHECTNKEQKNSVCGTTTKQKKKAAKENFKIKWNKLKDICTIRGTNLKTKWKKIKTMKNI